MKIYSWNVNGIRAVLRKDAFLPFVGKEQPDILCLQETKAKQEQAEIDLPDYREFWYSADKPGYSGTAIFRDRKSHVKGKSVSVRVDPGGLRNLKKKKTK